MEIQKNKRTSEKSFGKTFLLCAFFGMLGAHRFYVGKTTTAIVQIFTLGGLGIWLFIDYYTIVFGNFSDNEGLLIKN